MPPPFGSTLEPAARKRRCGMTVIGAGPDYRPLLPAPAEDQRVALPRELDQPAPGPRRHRPERRTCAVGADDPAFGQKDLLGPQAALPVLEVDQRQQVFPGTYRRGPVAGRVRADDLAELT